jgi:hypothetical protein
VRLFRRRQPPVLYVHLANDGGIFVARGDSGERFWTDGEGLRDELVRTQRRRGVLLYSRDDPGADPPPHVESMFDSMLDFQLPLQLVQEPWPEAVVPPDEREYRP